MVTGADNVPRWAAATMLGASGPMLTCSAPCSLPAHCAGTRSPHPSAALRGDAYGVTICALQAAVVGVGTVDPAQVWARPACPRDH